VAKRKYRGKKKKSFLSTIKRTSRKHRRSWLRKASGNAMFPWTGAKRKPRKKRKKPIVFKKNKGGGVTIKAGYVPRKAKHAITRKKKKRK